MTRLLMGGNDLIQRVAKIFQAGCGNDNGIAATVGVLGDAEKPAPGIFAQIENKIFALNGDIFTFQYGVHFDPRVNVPQGKLIKTSDLSNRSPHL